MNPVCHLLSVAAVLIVVATDFTALRSLTFFIESEHRWRDASPLAQTMSNTCIVGFDSAWTPLACRSDTDPHHI